MCEAAVMWRKRRLKQGGKTGMSKRRSNMFRFLLLLVALGLLLVPVVGCDSTGDGNGHEPTPPVDKTATPIA